MKKTILLLLIISLAFGFMGLGILQDGAEIAWRVVGDAERGNEAFWPYVSFKIIDF